MSSLTRRTMLKSAAAAPATFTILGAQDKSGSRRPVMGSGEYTYEADHDWGALPASIQYGNTHGVVHDSQGRIYVHHTVGKTSESPDTMVIFDRDGKFIKSWGQQFKGGAHGLHIQKEGSTEFLYLCDILHGAVVKATLDGEEVFRFGYPEQSDAYAAKKIPWSPTNLAVAPNGDFYVADGYGSSFVLQYNSKAEYIRTFGGLGSDPGKLNQPHGIWVDQRGPVPILTVADRRNYRLQYFTLNGEHLGFSGRLNYPCHFSTRNQLMVVPELEARVTILGPTNEPVAHLGQGPANFRDVRVKPRDAFVPGQFVAPHGACFDADGNIFVVEWVEVGRVTKLRKV
jgi:hypothetical protein